jgi:hypothetical protein
MKTEHAVFGLRIEQEDLLIFSHWELLGLLINGTAAAFCNNGVPVIFMCDSDDDFWLVEEFLYLLFFGKQITDL